MAKAGVEVLTRLLVNEDIDVFVKCMLGIISSFEWVETRGSPIMMRNP